MCQRQNIVKDHMNTHTLTLTHTRVYVDNGITQTDKIYYPVTL